jgi:hypothetical protein
MVTPPINTSLLVTRSTDAPGIIASPRQGKTRGSRQPSPNPKTTEFPTPSRFVALSSFTKAGRLVAHLGGCSPHRRPTEGSRAGTSGYAYLIPLVPIGTRWPPGSGPDVRVGRRPAGRVPISPDVAGPGAWTSWVMYANQPAQTAGERVVVPQPDEAAGDGPRWRLHCPATARSAQPRHSSRQPTHLGPVEASTSRVNWR